MASIRARKDNRMLFFDFRFQGKRCREYTILPDTPENRRTMQKVLKRMEAEITLGTFVYGSYFPNSPLASNADEKGEGRAVEDTSGGTPLFSAFAPEWYGENEVRWKRSYQQVVKLTLDRYLVPEFGKKEVGRITKAEILKFRSTLAKVSNGTKTGLSPDRINHIMTPLRMILEEAADRYNFTTPYIGIKQLKVPRTDVDPFSLAEVNLILEKVRLDFRPYYTVRFFTGMRTGEIDGLKWQYVNFERREIYIRETMVMGKEDTAKTIESQRTIQMVQPVYDALKQQFVYTGPLGRFVFCNSVGEALSYNNVNKRIWYPLLKRLGLKRRRAYQTRHTTATLWLASGENPEWIARQMGHINTKMLFTVYSRFVPNLTRRDGSAFERLLTGTVVKEVTDAA